MLKASWKFVGIFLLTIVVGIFLFWFWYGRGFPVSIGGEEVHLSDGPRSVRVDNARIVSAREYTLSAPYAAKVDTVFVDEGDVIGAFGSSILKLDTTELELELKKYQAESAREQALVKKLEQGTRYEELLIAQQKKKLADSSKKNTGQSAKQVLYDAFSQSDDAVRNQTDPMLIGPDGDAPELRFSTTDASLKTEIEKDRKSLSSTLDDWNDLTHDLKSMSDLDEAFDKTESHIRSVRTYLDEIALAVNGLSAGAISQDTIDTWKSATFVARVDVNTAAVALGEARSGYVSAKQESLVAHRELDLEIAGSDEHDIAAALDAADAAQSQADIISERLKQAAISTPENDVLVKKIFPKKGEFVTEGSSVAIVSSPNMEIEADIPEEDIRGVDSGAGILFRLAAFPETDIHGKIIRIEHQEVKKEGGTYFRIHASMESIAMEMNLRPGMTGDVIISTRNQGSIIAVPKQFLFSRDGHKMLKVITSDTGAIREKIVETGMEQGGSVEILSGLSVGDRIVE